MKLAYRDGEGLREVEIAVLAPGRWRVSVDGSALEVSATALGEGRWRLASDAGEAIAEITPAGERRFVKLGPLDFVIERAAADAAGAGRRRERGGSGSLEAPMPGLVTRVLVKDGDAVEKGQPLLALEAMKMEHVIRAPAAGRVKRVNAKAGEMVNGGVALVEMDAAG